MGRFAPDRGFFPLVAFGLVTFLLLALPGTALGSSTPHAERPVPSAGRSTAGAPPSPGVHRPSGAPCRYPCVVANIGLNTNANPVGVAYDSGQSEIFAADSCLTPFAPYCPTNNVSVVSTISDQVVDTVYVGSEPVDVAYDSGKGEVFVTNYNSSNVSVISDSNNTVVSSIPVGSEPWGIVYVAPKGELFVANSNSSNVSVISDASNTVVASVPVGSQPAWLAFDPATSEVFVTNYNSSNVSVISTNLNQVVATIPVGVWPSAVIYDSQLAEVWVGSNVSGNVSVISTATNQVVAELTLDGGVAGLAFDSGTGQIFATDWVFQNVVEISGTTAQVITNIPVGLYPYGIVYDPATGELFAADYTFGSLSVIWDGTHPEVWSLSAEPVTIRLGSTETVEASASGGQGALSYAYAGLPPGCASVDAPTISCIPSRPGTYELEVWANDSLGDSGTDSTELLVDPMEVRWFTAAPQVDIVGLPLQFNFSVLGGVGTLTYAYSGLPPGCQTANTSLLTCTPLAGGNYTIEATALDQADNQNSSNVSVQVIQTHPPTPSINTTTGFLGLPGDDGYYALIDAALVILLGVLLILLVRTPPRARTPGRKMSGGDGEQSDEASPPSSAGGDPSPPPGDNPVAPEHPPPSAESPEGEKVDPPTSVGSIS